MPEKAIAEETAENFDFQRFPLFGQKARRMSGLFGRAHAERAPPFMCALRRGESGAVQETGHNPSLKWKRLHDSLHGGHLLSVRTHKFCVIPEKIIGTLPEIEQKMKKRLPKKRKRSIIRK
ncbi:MAG: hypothetical protein Q4C72_00490 [Eubacteriales bacterium]|nr:hypothetical protein [Eubacteriales bacterium]